MKRKESHREYEEEIIPDQKQTKKRKQKTRKITVMH